MPHKILIIDDSGVLRDLMQDLLVSKGFEVESAHDGRSGISAFKSFRPDLVLLDRQLPDARGSAVLESIRKLDPKAKVIVLTGYADADGERKYRALGVKRFLSKGMGLSALLDIIGAQLAAPSA